MLSLPLIVIFIATIATLWWFTRESKPKRHKPIPGPIGIPLLGNVLSIGKKGMHVPFSRWADKYGDIFQIHLGKRKAVIISNPKWMKEIFTVDQAFTGREIFEGFEMYENEPLGITSIEGEFWEVHRRFLLRQLRDFGFGKSTMENLLNEEVKETIDRLKTFQGKTVSNTKEILQVAVINSLWMIVANTRYNHDDPVILKMMADGNRLLQLVMKRAIMLFVPWTRIFFPKLTEMDEARESGKKFYVDVVDKHKSTYQEDFMRDFIDVYLKEMRAQSTNPSSAFHGDRAERQLHAILADLMFAGTDTTSTTITWAILYLAKYVNIQQKLQEEIKKVTGNTRLVSLSDRQNMPYALAVIEETLRYSSIVATGVQHRAIEGKTFKEFYIPRGTWIFANLYHIHHSPKIWGDPDNFRPERFLSPDESTFKKNENLLPFQIGRRQCVGESLARDTIFLFLTNILQRFSISLDPNAPEPSFEPEVGFILTPQPFSIQLEDRIQGN